MTRHMLVGGCALIAAMAPSLAMAQAAPSAFTTATRYDKMRRVVGVIAPDPDGSGPIKFAATRNTYDARGNLTKVEAGELANWQSESVAPAGWAGFSIFRVTEFSYDLSGRKLTEKTVVAGVPLSAIQYSYDALDRVVCTTKRMNPATFSALPASACTLATAGGDGPDRITKNVYLPSGRLDKVQKAVGTTSQQDYATYTYTANGKIATMTDANGSLASMTYDSLDRQARWYFPSKTTTGVASTTDYEEYSYDAAGNRTKLRKRDGQEIAYSYDALDRVTLKNVPGTTADAYYGYDLRGLQLYVRLGSTSGAGITSTYDNAGRTDWTSTNVDGTARTIYYSYDKNGNRQGVQHPDGNTFNYEHDGINRPLTIKENGVTTLIGYTYNSEGELTSANRGVANTTYAYDDLGRTTSITHGLAGTSGDITFTFGYNPASQIKTRTRSNDSYVFGQEVAVARTYTVNGLNQYLAAGAAQFTYDANGNLTSDGSLNLTYDVENRLTGASGAKTATLKYDPLGRLYETNGGTAGVNRFLYDGDELIAEYDSGGTLLRRYVHGVGTDDPVIWYEGATVGTNRRHLFADHQGSIVSIADSAGTLVNINSYDDWGIPATTNLGRFTYTGQAWTPAVGMYYYKARFYSPTLGRFLQTDPIGYDDQINLYAYVQNDPVNGRDPTGMKKEDEPKGSCGLSGKGTSCTGSYAGMFGKSGSDGARVGQAGANDATNGNGHLSYSEANTAYQDGDGEPVVVDATKLTFRLTDSEPTKNGNYGAKTVGGYDFKVHGGVSLRKNEDGEWRVVPSSYGFETHTGGGGVKGFMAVLPRNMATWISATFATNGAVWSGTPYQIHYKGTPNVYCVGSIKRC